MKAKLSPPAQITGLVLLLGSPGSYFTARTIKVIPDQALKRLLHGDPRCAALGSSEYVVEIQAAF
jgi:hypothetical protein